MLIEFIGENIVKSSFSSSQRLTLFPDCQYEFGCFQIILKLKSNKISEKNSLWALKTNLIDRCPANPERVVSYFVLDPNKLRFIIDFPSVGYYPLERIHTYPTFELVHLWGSQEIEISNIIVKANIRKRCLDLANLSKL